MGQLSPSFSVKSATWLWYSKCYCHGVRTTIFLLLLHSVAVGGLGAQTVPDTPPAALASSLSASSDASAPTEWRSLTLDQALSLAEKNSPILAESAATVAKASAAVQSARAYKNPEAEFSAGHQSARPITTPGVPGSLWHYSASQTLEIPRERALRSRSAELELSASRHRASAISLSARADVKRAFFDVILRKLQLAQAKTNLELVEDLRRRVRLEVEVGEKGKLELTRAEAETARASAAVRSADVQLANARAIFKSLVGLAPEDAVDADGKLADSLQLPALPEARQQVLSAHPALAETLSRIDQAHTSVEHEKSLRIPQPTLSGEFERQPDISYFRFGLSIPIPSWDRRKGPIAEAQAELTRAEAELRRRRLELNAALERAWDQYQINNQQVQSLEAGSLREAYAAVDAARSAYKFGERGIVEVLDAQRVLQGVRSDLLDAQFARQTALIDLEELGVSLP